MTHLPLAANRYRPLRLIAVQSLRLGLAAWFTVMAAAAHAQYVVPVVQQQLTPVPVQRIQAPGYVPPPPVVRRPWWFTVQTVSGPGAVVPVARVAQYRPQPFRFPANAPVLAGKPILPPEGTPPAQWAAAPTVTPPVPPPQPAAVLPPAAAAPAAVARQPDPPASPPAEPPPAQHPAPAPVAVPSGQWATVAIDASQPRPDALAVTIPATSGSSMLAATPPPAGPVAAQSVSHPGSGPTPPPGPEPVAWWRCIGVSDGDTLTCLDPAGQQQKVALAGIDAPELGQPYGKESRELLAELAFGKLVAVVVMGRPAPGQAVCQVSVDGRDVGGTLVTAGAAWADPTTGSSMTAEQQQARRERSGLWANPKPVPPWEFRKTGTPDLQPAA